MRAVHGEEKVQKEVSGYYMALEWALVYAGMMIALPAREWEVFGRMSAKELAGHLRAGPARSTWTRSRRHRHVNRPSRTPNVSKMTAHIFQLPDYSTKQRRLGNRKLMCRIRDDRTVNGLVARYAKPPPGKGAGRRPCGNPPAAVSPAPGR